MTDTVEQYIEDQEKRIRPLLYEVRDLIRQVLPDAKERIAWGMPTYRMKIDLIHFAAQKKHLGIYPGSDAVEHFEEILKEKKLKYSKGSIQFPYDRIDMELIRKIALYVKENQ